jgi:spermidine synthase
LGLGPASLAGALLRFPGLEHRVYAEILPAVVRAAPLFQGNFGAVADAGIEIRVRDGRRELLQSSELYDLITLEPPPPSAAEVVNL